MTTRLISELDCDLDFKKVFWNLFWFSGVIVLQTHFPNFQGKNRRNEENIFWRGLWSRYESKWLTDILMSSVIISQRYWTHRKYIHKKVFNWFYFIKHLSFYVWNFDFCRYIQPKHPSVWFVESATRENVNGPHGYRPGSGHVQIGEVPLLMLSGQHSSGDLMQQQLTTYRYSQTFIVFQKNFLKQWSD